MDTRINNRYQLKKTLGAGGMGIVHLAVDRLTGETVALKQIKAPTDQLQFMSRIPSMVNTKLRLSLAREFQILAGLRHPHIISVLDYGFDQDQKPYYTMTYLSEAQTILEASQSLSLTEKLNLVQQILQALAYLHRRGIFHRDLKPDNILIDKGRLRVLDFGLAVAHTEDSAESKAGTAAYLAPELWLDEPFTEAADLFSAGMIAYELIAGKHAFGPLDSFLLNRLLKEEPDYDLLGLNNDLTGIFQKLLAKSPADRYQRPEVVLSDLSAALNNAAPIETIAIRESYLQAATFVGREKEMSQLKNALTEAQNGSSGIWLIGGESGVGKSRLVDEVRIQAMTRGQQVLRGQAVAGYGLPFQMWREPIRRLLLSQEVTSFQAAVLKDIVPDISTLIGRDIAAAPKLDGRAYQQRLILAIVDLLRGLSEPVVLLLEDLQWAGESLAVLQQLMHILEQLPGLLILGTYRHDEHPNLPDEFPGSQLLLLERLSDEAILELSQAMLGQSGRDPRIVSLLTQETEGNTFFILEVMRALAEEAGQLANVTTMTLPEAIFTSGMRHLLQRRIEQVPVSGQRLLRLAAAAGRQVDLRLLSALAPEADLETWLQRAAAAAVLTIQDEQWIFAHDKIREAILVDLEPDIRQTLHHQVAEAIEHTYPDDASYNETLLLHWHQAGNLEREMNYLPSVATTLIEIRGDHEYARKLLNEGLEALSEEDPGYVELLGIQADSHQRQGNYDQAKILAEQARKLASKSNDRPGLASSLSILGLIAKFQGAYQQAEAYHTQSLSIQRELGNKKGISMNLNNLGLAVYRQGHFSKANDYLQQSLIIKQELGNQLDISSTLNNLGLIAKSQGDYAKARDYFEQCLVIKEAIGDRSGIAGSYNNLGMLASNSGDYLQAVEYQHKAIAIKQVIGDRRGVANSFGNLGLTAYRQRDYDQARHYFERSQAIFQSIGDKRGIALGFHDLGRVAYHQGDFEKARDYLQQSLTMQQKTGAKLGVVNCYNRLGFVYLKLEPEQALRPFSEALTLANAIQAKPMILMAVVGFAWLYLKDGDVVRAGNLVGFVQNHPSKSDDVQHRVDEIMNPLENNLSESDLETAMTNGRSLELDQVVMELLDTFSNN